MAVGREYFWLFLILGIVVVSAVVSVIFIFINRCISRAAKHKFKGTRQTSLNSYKSRDSHLVPVAYSLPIRTNHLIPDDNYKNFTDENIPDDHDYEEAFPVVPVYRGNLSDEHIYEENSPPDYEENIPDDHDYEENIPDDHDYEENIPDESKPNNPAFLRNQPTHMSSTHHHYEPSLINSLHAQQIKDEEHDYIHVVTEESQSSLIYEAPDPADDANSQGDYDDIDSEDDYDDLG